jgi:hypothetical protein
MLLENYLLKFIGQFLLPMLVSLLTKSRNHKKKMRKVVALRSSSSCHLNNKFFDYLLSERIDILICTEFSDRLFHERQDLAVSIEPESSKRYDT